MEYANGGDLHAYVQQRGHLSEREARYDMHKTGYIERGFHLVWHWLQQYFCPSAATVIRSLIMAFSRLVSLLQVALSTSELSFSPHDCSDHVSKIRSCDQYD